MIPVIHRSYVRVFLPKHIMAEMPVSMIPETMTIHDRGTRSDSGLKTSMPGGRNPEYMEPGRPKTRPCMVSLRCRWYLE